MPKRQQPAPWEIRPDPQVMNPVNVMSRIQQGGKQETRDIRKEYTRLRDIAQKRIKRGGLNVQIPKLRDLSGNAELAKHFAALNRFIASETSTAKGRERIKQREIETLERHKFYGINTKNVNDFNRFMEWYRNKYTAELPEGRKMIFDSDMAVEIFHEINDRINSESKTATISRVFNEWMRENGENYGMGDIDDINRDARNAKRRASRRKKKKAKEQE